jgi:molybdopterin/thiamine biosynthesis adenylyltransferase
VILRRQFVFGRILRAAAAFEPIECISVADFTASHLQAFDQGTIQRLRRLWIAVIGASGTGSPLVEQLLRLGIGVLVIVDDNRMETRNVNRILNSTMRDVRDRRFKVDVLGDAAERAELGTEVIRLAKNLWHPDVIRTVAQCDVVFGCMDTVDGRYLLNALASYYTIPYFDIGVRLDAVRDGADKGRIREVCGTVNYLRPGRSSLMSRGLFTMADVAAAGPAPQ